MVSTTVYDDNNLDDADYDLGLPDGEVLDIVCCVLLVVSVLVPVLVVDGLIFSSTVEAFGELVFGLAGASFGAKLNGDGVGAVLTERMALNNFSPSMSTSKTFCATSEIALQTFDLTELWLSYFYYRICYKLNEFLGRK